MIAQRQHATAGALCAALEARLNEKSRRDGVDLQRLRRQVAFDRLLARMFDCSQLDRDGWVLKGGYALEMRFHQARSTKDLDLTVRRNGPRSDESPASLRERLQLAAEVQLPDFFKFVVGEAMAELNQAPEGGARFPVDARLDGRTFVRFHVAFVRRGTHSIPLDVPRPTLDWAKPFASLAAECGIRETASTAHERVGAFWRGLHGNLRR